MKSSHVIFLFFCVGIIITGCGKRSSSYLIGVSQCSIDEWRAKMNMEMIHEAALIGDVELVIKSTNDDSGQQIEQIRELIEMNVDLLIISPNETAPLTPIVEEAYGRGIPVILADRKILSDRYTAFIGADNFAIGREVGTYVVNLLGGNGNIVELLGLEGSSSAIDRHQGFFSIIAEHPEINIVSQKHADWNYETAYSRMIDILSEQSSVDLVFAHNDRMAAAAYEAARDKGREKDMYFVGIDALPGQGKGIDHVLNGRLNATFIYPTGGAKIIQLALRILRGEEYLKNNTLLTAVVDNTNARVLKLQSDQILEQLSKIDYFNAKIDVFTSQHEMKSYLLFSAIFIVFLMLILFLVLYRAYHSKALLSIKLERKNLAINIQKEILEKQRNELIDLSKKVKEATNSKLMFFTNISHEFRTPLTLISGPVESILDDPDTKAGHKRLLKLAQRNVDVLLKLVDEILNFRKYEAGELKLNIQHGNLREIIESWNESIEEVARNKHIKLSYHADVSKKLEMDFDLLKTERIYFNLLSNALKFTPPNGYIKIYLSYSDAKNPQFIELRITNSGKGIAPDKIPLFLIGIIRLSQGQADRV